MKTDPIPDIYKAFVLFLIVSAMWWFRPVPMIETMVATAIATILTLFRAKATSSPTTVVEDSKTTVINSAEQDQGSK